MQSEAAHKRAVSAGGLPEREKHGMGGHAAREVAARFRLPFHADLASVFDQKALAEFDARFVAETPFLPLYRRGDVMVIAVVDPFDMETLCRVQAAAAGAPLETHLTTEEELDRVRSAALETGSLLRRSAVQILGEYEQKLQRDESAMTLDEIRRRTESEPVVRMVSLILDEALTRRASDIHIEPGERTALIRFRVDGMLREYMELDRLMYLPVTSRIKILADIDIAEKRIPQDGRIRYVHGSDAYDLRVSTLPTHFGEKTVVRILKYDLSLLDLGSIGLDAAERETLESLIDKPQGMIIVTGPTGSGKSTTLFACLNRIRRKPINITTIENPIEYKIEGINQVQVNEKAGMTFCAALRSILRQDPDVILVGEIRDGETAQIAMQAAQTGHLVFTTLHTNDAVSAVTRLRDLGVPGYMISSSLLAIVAQRLVRTLCTHCRVSAAADDALRIRWKGVLGSVELPVGWRPVGCERCGNSGYYGRSGVYEVVAPGEHLRALIAENASEIVMRKALRSAGMRTMTDAGIAKIREGVTTPEEILRVVTVDEQS